MKFSWVFIALCALAIGAGSSLAEVAHKQNVPEGLEIQTPFKAETDMDMIARQEEEAAEKDDSKMDAENPIMEDGKQMDDEEESAVVKKDLPLEKKEENVKEMEKEEIMKAAENEAEIQAAKEAEMLEQPGMRRLARYLRNFHGRQVFRANAAIAAQKSNSVSDVDEDAIAEERAVRRRKRVRRRNSKNKVKRHHRNRHVANRRNSSRRRTNNRRTSKRKNVRRANSTRNKNRKNTRIVPVSDYDYPVRRRTSSGIRRKTGTRSGSKRKSSKRKSKKNKKNKKKKSKKNKKKKQKKRRNQNRQQDSNTARKGDDHKESPMEPNEGAQNLAQESQQQ